MKERLRSEIEEKYKWDLSKFCKSNEEFYARLKNCEKFAKKLEKFKGNLGQKEILREFYDELNKSDEEFYDLYMYADHHANEDMANSEFAAMSTQIMNFAAKLSENLAFYEPEMLKYSEEYLLDVANDPQFKDESFFIKKLLRKHEHTLSEKEEKLLSGTGTFAGDFREIMETYFAVNMVCEDAVDSKGQTHSVSDRTLSMHLFSPDRTLRKNAMLSHNKAIDNINTTMSKVYIASLKKDAFFAKAKKFNNSLEAKLFADDIDEAVYDRLLRNARSRLDIVGRYYATKAQVLGYDGLKPWDRLCPMVTSDKKYTFDMCCDLLRKALLPLGERYVANFDRAIKERWIDVYPNKNKRGGAYQSGAYGRTPIILANYTDDYNSVGTIAHEFGHAMHSVIADSAQGRNSSDYTIFCAEIASTTNEVLLNQYCLNSADTIRQKMFFLDSFIKDFISTFFRQAMFAEFERFAHNLVDNNLPISDKILNDEYARLNREYLPNMSETDILAGGWVSVPHFYSKFYVWQYSTGIVCAINFASKILNKEPNALENYYNFLRAGGSDYSLNILRKCGIDLETDEPYKVAFDFVEKNLVELERLAKIVNVK